ncbi:MAG: Uma2 family endonuclease [Gemmatimonadaceae bacterium]|nr:Uma2 family endonuclease [Gloeobacterales cyanobacterium ES-bin-141]
MAEYDLRLCMPSSEELLDSDETPVDNELQNLVPNLLEEILSVIWEERLDWYFATDMGIYHAPGQPAIVPDGFLSLGVERFISEEGRLSYVLWEEDGIPPILVIEIVSRTYRGEYEQKQQEYARLGALYYVIYNPRRRRKRRPLEVYQLIEGAYVLRSGEPVWMEEIGLGIGRGRGKYRGRLREWLYWYDRTGTRLLTTEEIAQQRQHQADQEQQRADQEQQRADQEQQRADQERQRADQGQQRADMQQQRAERLAQRLREQGIDPDDV